MRIEHKHLMVLENLTDLLHKRNEKIAFAESATAGYFMAACSCCKHSDVLSGGVVCYSASIKKDLLGVRQKIIDRFTAESIPVTEAIAQGLSKLITADYYVGITGLLKPGGSESAEKPVGTIFTSIFSKKDIFTQKTRFKGTPQQIRDQCLITISMLLIENISNTNK